MQIIQATTEADIQLATPLFDSYRIYCGQRAYPQATYLFLRERWIAGESVLFLALSEAVATGFVHLYPSFASDRLMRLWILNDLFVRPPDRGKGIGRALIRAAERYAGDTGSAGLTLGTAADNFDAHALYESEAYVRSEFFTYNRLLTPNLPGAGRAADAERTAGRARRESS